MVVADFINTPSDAMMLFVLFGCAAFSLWVMFRASHVSEQAERLSSEESEEEEAWPEPDEDEEDDECREEEESVLAQIDPGLKFMGKGYLLVIALMALGVLLISGFQALHPGQ